MQDFQLIKEFRIDDMQFQLLKSETGEFKTICTPEGFEPTEQVYSSFEQLADCFEEIFTREELLN